MKTLGCWTLGISSLLAQHDHPATQSSPAPRLAGMSRVQHRVHTSNAETQRYFNQGLGLIYAFNHEEAGRSFQRAAELDPKCAMAYWGIGLAVGPNYNDPDIDQARLKTALDAIAKAVALAKRSPAKEQAYIRALAKRYSMDPKADRKQLAVDYSRAMAEVMKRDPKDLDAAVLYAESAMDLRPWQLWTADGKPAEGTLEIVSVLESVLNRDPSHVGANHYYIHATEASPRPERALASAERLKTLAPAAGHLVHMPAHVYVRTGDYHSASLANENGAAADRAYIKSNNVSGMYAAMYYTHNLHFLAVSAGMEGRFADADAAAGEVVERATPFVEQMQMAEGFLPTRTLVLVRFRKWKEISDLPEPKENFHLAHGVWRFARGMSLAGTGNAAGAALERDALAAETKTIPAETPFGFNTARQMFDIAARMLDAAMARARGDLDRAAGWLREAAQLEDALNYDEPPDWYLPARESLGAVLLALGRAQEAEAAFRQDLERHLKNPRSLFGLAESLQKQGKMEEAARVRAEFESGWKNADTTLRIEEL